MRAYPTDEELRKIEVWDMHDFDGLMEYIEPMWKGMGAWYQKGRKYRIATGGWSGNEDIIVALKRNNMFWARCWMMSARGGLYIFLLPPKIKERE